MTDRTRAPTPSSVTILVVEDEILIRMVISQFLRDCGYRVIEAANADEATMVLRQDTSSINIVFSDVQMPGEMDGFALAQWVRVNQPGVKVILAGSPARAANAAAELCDSGPQLGKPYQPETVLQEIQRLLAAQQRDLK